VNSADNLKSKVKAVSTALASLALANVHLDFTADASSSYDLTATYDQQFARADTDNNGYLEEKEVSNNGVFRNSFKAMDRDNDGKVFKKEMQAYVRSRSNAAHSRTVLDISDQGRDLFKILDLNRDSRLSYTEFESAIGRVVAWDTDNDQQISKSEIPRQCRLTLQRARPAGLIGGSVAVAAYSGGSRGPDTSPTGGPLWHQRMDVNRDGEVSLREFLGKLKRFEQLDSDSNGRINVSEAGQLTNDE
jgi:Ca2+-binding EF-hand superfamily protein